ncbi:MAG TPA: hypothetical protein VGQ62_05930 [Chloroflexota bacterium]|jgi:hypothetical protein|nr:hypothetical protein [Chloroflexota bacterium]
MIVEAAPGGCRLLIGEHVGLGMATVVPETRAAVFASMPAAGAIGGGIIGFLDHSVHDPEALVVAGARSEVVAPARHNTMAARR